MANICDNTLRCNSSNPKNLDYIENFFNDWNASIEQTDEENMYVYFDSKWVFPEEEMNKLYKGIPDKEDIDMTCLSVEWGCTYCEFHQCNEDGWIEC